MVSDFGMHRLGSANISCAGNEKDLARDLLLFVTAYLPPDFQEDLPTNLVAHRPSSNGRQRTRENLHTVGHSLGAKSSILVAAHAPDLFASITCFDPAVIPRGPIQKAFCAIPKDALTLGLQLNYPSREHVIRALSKNRRTRGWDDRVRRIFTDRGVMADDQGKARLCTHPRLDWAICYDQETVVHTYEALVDVTCPINLVLPPKPFAAPTKALKAILDNLPQETRLSCIRDTTHHLPWEKVEESTECVVAWLGDINRRPSAKL